MKKKAKDIKYLFDNDGKEEYLIRPVECTNDSLLVTIIHTPYSAYLFSAVQS